MAYLDYPGLQRYHGKVQDEIDELKDDLDSVESGVFKGYCYVTKYTNGSWFSSPPGLSNSATRIRPSDFIYVSAGDKIFVENGSYVHACAIWVGTMDSYTVLRNDNSFKSTNEEINIANDGFAIVTFADPDNMSGNLNPEDFDGAVNISSYAMRKFLATFTNKGYISASADVNNLEDGSIYSMNFSGGSTSIPSNLPFSAWPSTTGNQGGFIITTRNSVYGVQVFIMDDVYLRVSTGTSWNQWRKLSTSYELVFNRTYFRNIGYIDSGNVNINNLPDGSIYSMNFAPNSSSIPTNLPFEKWPVMSVNNSGLLLTTKNSVYGVQLLIVDDVYIRIYASSWGSWRKLSDSYNKSVLISKTSPNAKYTNILTALLSEPNGTTFLVDGSYDLYDEYKEHYGTDFWDNYQGYTGVTDGVALGYGGLPLKTGMKLIGYSNAEISIEVETPNPAIASQFSLIFPFSDTTIQNIKLKCMDGSIRYHIHDDWPSQSKGATNIIKNNVFIGEPSQFGCIGGGFGINQNYIIEDNIFLGGRNKPSIFYHNHSGSNAENMMKIHNNYCDSSIILYKYGSSTKKSYAIVSDNTATEISCIDYPGYTPPDNIEMFAFNNTIIS